LPPEDVPEPVPEVVPDVVPEDPVRFVDVDSKATHWPSREIAGLWASPFAAPPTPLPIARVAWRFRSKTKICRDPLEPPLLEAPLARRPASLESKATRRPSPDIDTLLEPAAAVAPPPLLLLLLLPQLGMIREAARSSVPVTHPGHHSVFFILVLLCNRTKRLSGCDDAGAIGRGRLPRRQPFLAFGRDAPSHRDSSSLTHRTGIAPAVIEEGSPRQNFGATKEEN
jgi:hypothetical protein